MNIGGWTEGNKELRQAILDTADCDLICLCETHLVEDQNIEVNGYKWFGHNRQAVYVNAPTEWLFAQLLCK